MVSLQTHHKVRISWQVSEKNDFQASTHTTVGLETCCL